MARVWDGKFNRKGSTSFTFLFQTISQYISSNPEKTQYYPLPSVYKNKITLPSSDPFPHTSYPAIAPASVFYWDPNKFIPLWRWNKSWIIRSVPGEKDESVWNKTPKSSQQARFESEQATSWQVDSVSPLQHHITVCHQAYPSRGDRGPCQQCRKSHRANVPPRVWGWQCEGKRRFLVKVSSHHIL